LLDRLDSKVSQVQHKIYVVGKTEELRLINPYGNTFES